MPCGGGCVCVAAGLGRGPVEKAGPRRACSWTRLGALSGQELCSDVILGTRLRPTDQPPALQTSFKLPRHTRSGRRGLEGAEPEPGSDRFVVSAYEGTIAPLQSARLEALPGGSPTRRRLSPALPGKCAFRGPGRAINNPATSNLASDTLTGR